MENAVYGKCRELPSIHDEMESGSHFWQYKPNMAIEHAKKGGLMRKTGQREDEWCNHESVMGHDCWHG